VQKDTLLRLENIKYCTYLAISVSARVASQCTFSSECVVAGLDLPDGTSCPTSISSFLRSNYRLFLTFRPSGWSPSVIDSCACVVVAARCFSILVEGSPVPIDFSNTIPNVEVVSSGN
jgi:hypothetical protein